LLALDKLLVEGFDLSELRRIAAEKADVAKIDSKLGSLKVLALVLAGLGYDESVTTGLMKPLFVLHNLRGKVVGHASGDEAKRIKAQILKEHGSYAAHFRALCADCDQLMKELRGGLPGRTV